MRIEAFFSELRSFAVALEDDCSHLRKAVVAPQPRYSDGSEAAIDALRLLHDETTEVIDTVDSLETRLFGSASMAAVVEATARMLAASQQQLARVEQELAQYGFAPLPRQTAAAVAPSSQVETEPDRSVHDAGHEVTQGRCFCANANLRALLSCFKTGL